MVLGAAEMSCRKCLRAIFSTGGLYGTWMVLCCAVPAWRPMY